MAQDAHVEVVRLRLIRQRIARLELEVEQRSARLRRISGTHKWQRLGARHRTR